MPRRQRGQLWLVPHSRLWRVRFRSPPDSAGKRRQHSVDVGTIDAFPTEESARLEADRILAKLAPQPLVAGSTLPWSTWCDRFVSEHVALLRKGSRSTYLSVIETHLRPTFAQYRTHELTSALIQSWVSAMARHGCKASSIANRVRILRAMLNAAETAGLTASAPPPRSIRLPRDASVRATQADRALTAHERERLLAAAGPLWRRVLFVLLAQTGLRCGEALALGWQHIDRARGVIRVRQSASGGEIAAVKTKSSMRDVPMTPVLRNWLDAYQRESGGGDVGLLFANRRGRARSSSGVRKRHLQPLLKALGLREHLGLHSFRHAIARDLLASGASSGDVRNQLGHGNIATTNLYASGNDSAQRAALESLERSLNLPVPPQSANLSLNPNGPVDRHADQ